MQCKEMNDRSDVAFVAGIIKLTLVLHQLALEDTFKLLTTL